MDPLTELVYLNRGQTVVRGEQLQGLRSDKKESYDKLNLAISATKPSVVDGAVQKPPSQRRFTSS